MTDHALITRLIIQWSRSWSYTDHVTVHALITWICTPAKLFSPYHSKKNVISWTPLNNPFLPEFSFTNLISSLGILLFLKNLTVSPNWSSLSSTSRFLLPKGPNLFVLVENFTQKFWPSSLLNAQISSPLLFLIRRMQGKEINFFPFYWGGLWGRLWFSLVVKVRTKLWALHYALGKTNKQIYQESGEWIRKEWSKIMRDW